MALVHLLGLDARDVYPRRLCLASSLKTFRPSFAARPLRIPSVHGFDGNQKEATPFEQRRQLDGTPDASASLSKNVFHSTVSTLPPISLPNSQMGMVGMGMGMGLLLAFLVQSILDRFRNKDRSILMNSVRAVTSSVPSGDDGETIEWVNMCWRKIWRVYQQGLERWLAGVLQRVFDRVIREGTVPKILKGIKIVEMNFDHQAPYFTNLRRRTSRKDSDLNGVVDVRYTGGARMLLMLEVGGGRYLVKVPVLVSDLDLECQLWLKAKLAPLTPYLGSLSFAFVRPPNIKVQLAPYNSVRLMRIPVLQNFLTRLLTKELPGLMTLPKRLEIQIPPAITAVAEAAVGRDAVMKAVASAVLQADALEQSLLAVLPLGPQTAAGGITLPKSFQGELTVALLEGRDLLVWGFPWQSNPFCRLTLGKQAVDSKKENDTGTKGGHRRPIWNQEFEFLVENLDVQTLVIYIKDSPITGRPDVGKVEFPLSLLPMDGSLSIWLPVQQVNPGQEVKGELHLDLSYKPFVDEDFDSGYVEAEKHAKKMEEGEITDIKSAAAASSKAAAAASAAFSAIAITRAAAARAAHKAQNAAATAAKMANLAPMQDDEDDEDDEDFNFDPDEYNLEAMDELSTSKPLTNGSGPSTDHQEVTLYPVEMPTEDASLSDDAADRSDPYEPSKSEKDVVEVRASSTVWDVHDVTTVDVPSTNGISSQRTAMPTKLLQIDTAFDPSSLTTTNKRTLPSSEPKKIQRKPWWTGIVRRRQRAMMTALPAEPQKSDRIRWWMWLTSSVAFWKSRSQIATKGISRSKNKKDKRSDSVLLPPELPLEEIAKEVVKLKTVTDKDEEERMQRVYSEAVERSDRKWVMLLCFLIVVSIGMLSVVALRIGPL